MSTEHESTVDPISIIAKRMRLDRRTVSDKLSDIDFSGVKLAKTNVGPVLDRRDTISGSVVSEVAGVPIKARVLLGDAVHGAELLGVFAELNGGHIIHRGHEGYAIVFPFNTSVPGDPVARALRVRNLKQQKADLDAKIEAAERGDF